MNPSQEMPVHLRRATTVAEYEYDLGVEELTRWQREKWAAFRGEVEAELAAGGELWEWEYQG